MIHQIVFCLWTQLLLTNSLGDLSDPLLNILSYLPQDPEVTHFRAISKKFNAAFIDSNRPIFSAIRQLHTLLDEFAQESFSENQTHQIMSAIIEICDNPQVALNEIFIFKWPQIINTWYHKMAHNKSNYDKIYEIRKIFYLLPFKEDNDEEDTTIEKMVECDTRNNSVFHVANETQDDVLELIATSHAIAIHLMYTNHTTYTTMHDPRIEILKLIYCHLWEISPGLPSFNAVTYLIENDNDHDENVWSSAFIDELLNLINSGFIILHPQYTEANFNNISLVRLMDEYLGRAIFDISPNSNLGLLGLHQLDAKFVIKVLQSMDKRQLRNCIDEQTHQFAQFMSKLHFTVKILYERGSNNMMDSLLFEIKRLDALNLLAYSYSLADLKRTGTYSDSYIKFISTICALIMDPNESQDHNITQQRSNVIASSILLWLNGDQENSMIKISELSSKQLFDRSLLRQMVKIYNKCRFARDHDQFLMYSVWNLCRQRTDWDFTTIWELDWMQQLPECKEAIIKWRNSHMNHTDLTSEM